MLVTELAELIGAKIVSPGEIGREVLCGYACDLLSWVMANGKEGCGWITVQTHLNVVAVASLHDMAAIIYPENIDAESESIEKAREEGIAVLKSDKTAYEIAGLMNAAKIPPV